MDASISPKEGFFSLAFAAALTFATVHPFASMSCSLASAQTFTGILAFAALAVHGSIMRTVTSVRVATGGQSHGSSEHSCHRCGYDYGSCCFCHTSPFRFMVYEHVVEENISLKT